MGRFLTSSFQAMPCALTIFMAWTLFTAAPALPSVLGDEPIIKYVVVGWGVVLWCVVLVVGVVPGVGEWSGVTGPYPASASLSEVSETCFYFSPDLLTGKRLRDHTDAAQRRKRAHFAPFATWLYGSSRR